MVPWSIRCASIMEGGLWLKDIGLLNEAMLGSLTWQFLSRAAPSLLVLESRFLTATGLHKGLIFVPHLGFG